MTEFGELSSTEVRILREHRALRAIQSRPVETVDATLPTRRAIIALIELATVLEPKAEVWPTIRSLLAQHTVKGL